MKIEHRLPCIGVLLSSHILHPQKSFRYNHVNFIISNWHDGTNIPFSWWRKCSTNWKSSRYGPHKSVVYFSMLKSFLNVPFIPVVSLWSASFTNFFKWPLQMSCSVCVFRVQQSLGVLTIRSMVPTLRVEISSNGPQKGNKSHYVSIIQWIVHYDQCLALRGV